MSSGNDHTDHTAAPDLPGHPVDPAQQPHTDRAERDDHDTKLRALREALIDAENSGPSQAFDLEEFLTRKRTDFDRSTR